MDKIRINFIGQESFSFEHEFRIPEDLSWFIITRYNNENDNHETDKLVYNGNKILLYGYFYKNNKKITKYYNENQKKRKKLKNVDKSIKKMHN